MNKREFLNKLNEYLSYELPESMVREQLSFYSSYIDTESDKGRRITEITDELGDPQLIARSIIDAAKSGPDGIPGTSDDIDFGDNIASNSRGAGSFGGYASGDDARTAETVTEDGAPADDHAGHAHDPWGGNIHVYNFGCFTAVLVMLIFFAVFSIIGAFIGALSPILAPVCIVLLIVWLLNRTTGGRR